MPWLLAFTLLLAITGEGSAPGPNVRETRSLGLSAAAGGVCLAGLSLDWFAASTVDIEISGGIGYGAGMRYHFIGHDPAVHWSPFVGGCFGALPDLDPEDDEEDIWQRNWAAAAYFPAGVHYIAPCGLSIAVEFGYLHGFETDSIGGFDIPFGALRAGWRF